MHCNQRIGGNWKTKTGLQRAGGVSRRKGYCMELINNFDKEICFEDLEKAKKYFIPGVGVDSDIRSGGEYLGNDPKAYTARWDKYVEDIKNAKDLRELCNVLNRETDEFGNGSEWAVKGKAEEEQKLYDVYNNCGDFDALNYMYVLLKDNQNPEMLELLDRVNTLHMETTLGTGREDYTDEEAAEYHAGMHRLLSYFGVDY